jgi:hypothetical protein
LLQYGGPGNEHSSEQQRTTPQTQSVDNNPRGLVTDRQTHT